MTAIEIISAVLTFLVIVGIYALLRGDKKEKTSDEIAYEVLRKSKLIEKHKPPY